MAFKQHWPRNSLYLFDTLVDFGLLKTSLSTVLWRLERSALSALCQACPCTVSPTQLFLTLDVSWGRLTGWGGADRTHAGKAAVVVWSVLAGQAAKGRQTLHVPFFAHLWRGSGPLPVTGNGAPP